MCMTAEQARCQSTNQREVTRAPLANIRALHDAIRRTVAAIEADVRAVDVLSPDALFVDIYQRVDIVQRIVLSHCRAEDETLIPALAAKAKQLSCKSTSVVSSSGTDGPPAKRPRNSPISIDIAICTEDHDAFAKGFLALRKILSQIISDRRTQSDSYESDLPVSNDSDPNAVVAPWDYSTKSQSRTAVLRRLKEETKRLANGISRHLDNEERELLPQSQAILSPMEQGHLLVNTLLLPDCPHWPRSFEYMQLKELQSLLYDVSFYATDEQLERIATMAAPFISKETWAQICHSVPALSKFSHLSRHPFKEVTLIRAAMRNELRDLIPFCRNVNISCKSQLHSLASRFEFVEKLFSSLVNGEKELLSEGLQAKLSLVSGLDSEFSLSSHHLKSEEIAINARRVNQVIFSLAANSPTPEKADLEMSSLMDEFHGVSMQFVEHMDAGDRQLYPLIAKTVDLKEQKAIVERILKYIPDDIKRNLLPWMFNQLPIDELESMMRKLMRRVSGDELRVTVESIVESVEKGTTDGCEWAELCSRLPEVRNLAKNIDNAKSGEKYGPVSEILRVHKAIRVDINTLLRRIRALPVTREIPNPRTLSSIATSVAFLRRMVDDHSRAEDDILLPKLEGRKSGITIRFIGEHCTERLLFGVLAKCLQDLQCVTGEQESAELVWRLRVAARTLRDDMAAHLSNEEENLWPLVTTLFDREEQSQIVALIFGNMSADSLRELLPWMMRVLSIGERNEMMEHILQVTRSTMFDKWLKTWLPLDFEPLEVSQLPTPNSGSSSFARGSSSNTGPQQSDYTAMRKQLLDRCENGRDGIQEMIRAVAKIKDIDHDTRTRLMQDIMLAPFTERQEKLELTKRRKLDVEDNLEASYTTDKRGNKVLGCRHYQRSVKLRAACCSRLYPCRLCHDDAEETHVLDRYTTTEILCMHCKTLQPVSNQCVNKACKRSVAKYFCSVCKIYENNPAKNLYHCHSCNVCRLGKGLGVDFFHCMKCNQCMSMKYQTRGHKCVPNAMESDCPVCFEYLFTSMSRIKYLKCGHLMHASCYSVYSKNRISCPVCSKSLEEMAPVYKRIDAVLAKQSIPEAYRQLQCDVFCNDCNQRSKIQFHILYRRCPKCHSYNTRNEGVERQTT